MASRAWLAALATAGTSAPAEAAVQCAPEVVISEPGTFHVMFHGISPDGRTLAAAWEKGAGASAARGAYLLDLKTRRRTDLPHLNNAPSFSPDGRYLVSANYSADRSLKTELVELDLRTKIATTHASGPSAEWLATYAPDGRSILFNSTRTGGSDLYRVDRATGALERLTSDARYEAHAQHVGRAGDLLFHRQIEGDNYDVMWFDGRSGTARAIGATGMEEAYAAASPDRRWIAFSAVTAPKAQPNLFIMRADGTGRRQLTTGAAKDAYATWSRDGRWLYFVRFHGAGSGIYRLSMKDGRCSGPDGAAKTGR